MPLTRSITKDATVMFRYRKEKVRFSAGISVQPQKTYMDYTKGSLDTTVVRNVLNWAPRIDFRYKFPRQGSCACVTTGVLHNLR